MGRLRSPQVKVFFEVSVTGRTPFTVEVPGEQLFIPRVGDEIRLMGGGTLTVINVQRVRSWMRPTSSSRIRASSISLAGRGSIAPSVCLTLGRTC